MTALRLHAGGREYAVKLSRGISLAIPMQFDGPQPSFFGAPPAVTEVLRDGDFVGDTRQGGSCNVGQLHLTPHCNGTHTESVAHVTDDGPLLAMFRMKPMGATLVSLSPEARGRDRVLTQQALEQALARHNDGTLRSAVIVRTLPNDAGKLACVYREESPPPFFEPAALGLLTGLGVEHVLTDLPSLDPMHDNGRLAAHRAFWGLLEGERRAARAARPHCTVTEMVYVPDEAPDGHYLLDLQIPAFMSDAAPSRPILYPLERR